MDLSFTYKQYFINDLVVGRLLGSGSFSEVCLVTIKGEGKLGKEGTEVAGKIINSRSEIMIQAFMQEVNMLNVVSNQCNFIVNVFGIVMKPNIILF